MGSLFSLFALIGEEKTLLFGATLATFSGFLTKAFAQKGYRARYVLFLKKNPSYRWNTKDHFSMPSKAQIRQVTQSCEIPLFPLEMLQKMPKNLQF